MLRNHETFVELGNLLDAYERNETGALERLEEFCRVHQLRFPKATPKDEYEKILISYIEYKRKDPSLTDRKLAKMLGIGRGTLSKIKVEHGLARRNKKHV